MPAVRPREALDIVPGPRALRQHAGLHPAGRETLRLLDGTPGHWLEAGRTIMVRNAPTPWGSISVTAKAFVNRVEVRVERADGFGAVPVALHLQRSWRRLTIDGKSWQAGTADAIDLPPDRVVDVVAWTEPMRRNTTPSGVEYGAR